MSPRKPSATQSDVAGLPRERIPTTHGPAEVRVVRPAPAGSSSGVGSPARGTLLVGHGAGGQRDTPDVLALTDLAQEGWTVVLVDQPWRVAGRRIATPAPTLDRAWLDIVAVLAEQAHRPGGSPLPRPWVYAGRSAGARVACRTSTGTDPGADPGSDVAAVVALSFPLHPPDRPEKTRAHELRLPLDAGLPTLVVQGASDPMGTPGQIAQAVDVPPTGMLTLVTVPGSHSPTRDVDAVRRHVRDFLDRAVPHPQRC